MDIKTFCWSMEIPALGPTNSQFWPNACKRQSLAPYFRRAVGRDGDEGRELVGMEQSSVCIV